MNKEEALKVVKKQLKWLDDPWKQLISGSNKKTLIGLAVEREKLASEFLGSAVMSLSKFWSANALIKRAIINYDTQAEDENSEQDIPELIDLYAEYVYDRLNFIKEGLGHYHQKKKDLELEKISMKDLMGNYEFYFDEDYLPIKETFEDNLILNEAEAKEYFDEHKKEYDRVRNAAFNFGRNKAKPRGTPSESIHAYYDLLQSFPSALTRTSIYAEIFNLQYLREKRISPEFILDLLHKLVEFIRQHPQTTDLPQIKVRKFKILIRKLIKKKFENLDEQVVYDSLVFKKENSTSFPFFIELNGNVLISFSVVFLMALFCYRFYYKDLYDKETQKRSEIFEKETVPAKLKELGYKVKPNYKDKKNASLEIDHIAWKNDRLIVIETKIWDIKFFFEHRKVHDQIERDLKGIVDGKKFTTKNGSLTEKDIPSIIEKIDHVKENIQEICEDSRNIKKVSGAVVTKVHPILNEYKGVKFRAFKRIEEI